MKKQLTTAQAPQVIKNLAETIRTEIEVGKERAYLAMEQEKRLTYWNVGKHIKQHLLQNQGREEYGKYVIVQLANELKLTRAILYESVKCYEEYPRIVHLNEQLTWSHLRVLLNVPEKKSRKAFEKKIIAEKLTVFELKKLVKNGKNISSKAEITILQTSRGTPYTYQFKTIQKNSVLDLGFSFYIQNPFEKTNKDNIIQVEKIDKNYQYIQTNNLQVPHYTYKARVKEVIDGDTIWVNIDLGFNSWTTQKIRLKGINAKELETKEGQNAKDYVESRLKECKFIVIKTYWRDKFTRYLADVFYMKQENNMNKVIGCGKFLNQELLDGGLAVKY